MRPDASPTGVAREIDARACASLVALCEDSFARFRDRPAFTSMGVTLSFGEIDRLSAGFGAFLRRQLGLTRGERIAIMLPNLLQYPVALIGALRAGLTVVNVNPLYTSAELAFQLADSGAGAIVVLENFARTLQDALPGTRVRYVITTKVGDLFPPPKRWLVNLVVGRRVPAWRIPGAHPFRRTLSPGRQAALDEAPLAPDDVALLQYTGGTTGRPKGAILTHGNLVANVEQTRAWIGATLEEGKETVVTALPLYHVFALMANLFVFIRLGGCSLLIANPRDIAGFVKELRRTRFTAITGVNTLYGALLDAQGFDAVCAANRGALKLAVAGGMAVQRTLAERWQKATGAAIIEGYGLTEASPNVCANPADAREFSGKLGRPLPSTAVAILDDQGAAVPPGEIGEICVKGPQVMRGYWNAPEETARAFTADGWLRTGDLGRMGADGWLEFVERRKDVIVVSGFKAYPAEIEEVALRHPGVKDAGAGPVPDARSGEAVALYVVKRDPALTAEALQAHCSRYLTGYKLPKRIEFRASLPKSPIGKTLRRQLAAPAAIDRHRGH